MAEKVNLTRARIDALASPAAGAIYVHDTKVQGLAVRVTAAGTKTFVLYRRIGGRPQRITLGRVGALGVDGARKTAQRINGEVAAGVDVLGERKRARTRGLTLADAWARYGAVASRKLRSWHDLAQLWRDYAEKPLGKVELAKLATDEVQRVVDKIAAGGKARTANKVAALLSALLSFAVKRGWAERNVAKGVERYPERSRERFLRPDELPRFLTAVQAEEQPWRDYLLLCLLTGARRAAVCAMRWQDIDLAAGVWHLPREASKSKRALALPLVPAAVDILRQRQAERTDGWVFPSPSSATGHAVEPRKPWLRVLARAGLNDLRLHDVRRTLGSWLAASGANGFLIQKALGHASINSTAVYARLDLDPVRKVMEATTRAMLDAQEAP